MARCEMEVQCYLKVRDKPELYLSVLFLLDHSSFPPLTLFFVHLFSEPLNPFWVVGTGAYPGTRRGSTLGRHQHTRRHTDSQ